MKKRKLLSLILVLVLVISLLAGCSKKGEGNGGGEDKGDDKVVLTVATSAELGNCQPWGATSTSKFYVKSAVYEPLFWINMDKQLAPILAKSYEYLGDGSYEVTLFDYIVDSANNPIKASDVVFCMDNFIADGSQSRLVASLESYEATGEYTVRFNFTNDRIGNFESLVSQLYVCSQASFEASKDQMLTTPVGSGRYIMTGYTSGTEYTFEKRDSYWQTDEQYMCEKNAANSDVIVVKEIASNSTIAVSLEMGNIDFTENIIEEDRANFVSSDGLPKDGYVSLVIPNNSLIHLTYNCGPNSQLQDINLRKAISYAIDSAAIAANAQGNLGFAVDNLINPNWLDADASLNAYEGGYYEYDVDKAIEYVGKSNYDGSPLRLLVMPGENTNAAAVLIENYCKQAGINIELLTYEEALYKDLRSEETGLEYDIDIGGIYSSNAYTWKNSAELDINAYKSGINHCFIYDEKLQELYDTAANISTASPEAANELIQYASDQCYQYGIFYFSNEYFARSDVISEIVVGPSEAFALLGAFVVNR